MTYGDRSPIVRRLAEEALHDVHGYAIRPLPGAGHFVAHDAPEILARIVLEVVQAIPIGQGEHTVPDVSR